MTPGRTSGPEPQPEAVRRADVRVPATDSSRMTQRTDSGLAVVPATRTVVVGRSGEARALLVVTCPWCADEHQHLATADFRTGQRAALCRQGSYLVVAPRRGGADV